MSDVQNSYASQGLWGVANVHGGVNEVRYPEAVTSVPETIPGNEGVGVKL